MFSQTILCLCCAVTFMSMPMGADHEPGSLSKSSAWPAGFHAAVNKPNRIHGYWINTSDMLFYKGKTKDLNLMIKELSQIKKVQLSVVLHAGSQTAKSPWGERTYGNTSWKVTSFCSGGFGNADSIQVDVWLGHGVELNALKIPESFAVKNGGEIERFIKARNTTK